MGSHRVSRRQPRRVAVLTGTRAEYGLLQSVMTAIAAEPRLKLQTVVTGIHLLPEFGRTADVITRDGWRVDAQVPMQTGSDDPLDQAAGLARGVAGIAAFLAQARTDIVLVLGDRIEAMAGALAAVTTGRVLAHVHGGDVAPGDFDDSLRHAITKLAHVHFPATRRAARRLVRMGETPERVYVVGAPGLDRLRELLVEQPPRRSRAGHALVIFHASGRPPAVEERAMNTLLDAVAAAGLQRVIIYPNTDRGQSGVLRAIRRHERESERAAITTHRSLPRDDFLRLLMSVDVLVGNSSSGVIEAPLAGTPSVTIGDRQAGREPAGSSVICVAESERAVRAGLRRALRLKVRRRGRSVYGDGQAGPRIAQILAGLDDLAALARKRIRY
jgi:UDP-N-acetylglucosamine 2-epimerase (non-hydrolysing)/GDP/UDP-N,N'-diacetylbacillosamine 2-epimerase (hydrolysing)